MSGWLLVAILAGLGLDLDELDRDLLRLFSANPAQALSAGYFISWLVVLPPVVLLRARRCLSLWPAVAMSAVIPTAGAATMSLLVWWASRGSATGMSLTFLYLAYLFVPGSIAVAAAFWWVYALLTGRRFFEPPVWQRGQAATFSEL